MSRSRALDATHRRAGELDALSAIISWDGRDKLATLLTDEDVATLKHLAATGMGDNTLRALTSDLGYLEAWALIATSNALPWPAPADLVLKFVAHHLWDPVKRESDPEHGMPDAVESDLYLRGLLKVNGPHAPSTVRRRLATWSTLHQWRGFQSPLAIPGVKKAIGLAVRASARPRRRKSARALTRDILDHLLASCAGNRLVDRRDRALLLLAFASGGRRRSEVARLTLEDFEHRSPVPADPKQPHGPTLPSLALRLGRTKTTSREQDERVLVIGRPVEALEAWIQAAGLTSGPVFRGIDRWDNLRAAALDDQSVNAIVKRRCRLAGLDPSQFSAHGLRSGYMTEAARRGVPIQEAMRQSTHRSVQQASTYYNEVEIERGYSARLG